MAANFKITYVSPDDTDVLMSDTYDTFADALTFQENNAIDNYFIAQKVSETDAHSEWKLLNKGLYGVYKFGMILQSNWLGITSVLLVVVFMVYYNRKAKVAVAAPTL